jgi:hypothetical protein
MHKGACATYPNVPHQYYLRGPQAARAQRQPEPVLTILELAAQAGADLARINGINGQGRAAAATTTAAAEEGVRVEGGSDGGRTAASPASHGVLLQQQWLSAALAEPKACAAEQGWVKNAGFDGATTIGASQEPDAAACCDKANSLPYVYYPTIGWECVHEPPPHPFIIIFFLFSLLLPPLLLLHPTTPTPCFLGRLQTVSGACRFPRFRGNYR